MLPYEMLLLVAIFRAAADSFRVFGKDKYYSTMKWSEFFTSSVGKKL